VRVPSSLAALLAANGQLVSSLRHFRGSTSPQGLVDNAVALLEEKAYDKRSKQRLSDSPVLIVVLRSTQVR